MECILLFPGVMHGVLERWAEDSELEGAKELFKTLKGWREAEGKELPEMPEVKVEEMHICYICEGQNKKRNTASALSLTVKLLQELTKRVRTCRWRLRRFTPLDITTLAAFTTVKCK